MRVPMIFCLLVLGGASWAIDTQEALEDPVLQARYERLTWELRCLVCQNQNIADSNAGLAQDLRGQVREMLLAGNTDKEILDYMTDRYGDFVLYRPRFTPKNWLLWGAPLLLLGGGVLLLVRIVRAQSVRVTDDDDIAGEEPSP